MAKQKPQDNKNKTNKNKKVKKASKICLDSPFEYKFPRVSQKNAAKINDLLKTSLSKFALIENNDNKTDKKVCKKVKVNKSLNSYVTIGFNAVMRALEQDKMKCIFVKENAKPEMIKQSFIGVCSIKGIPLVSLKELPNIVEKTLKIKSAVAVGLKDQACKYGNDFYELYQKCCPYVNTDNQSQKVKTVCTENQNWKPLKDSLASSVMRDKPPKGTFHLIRKDPKRRVFNPPKNNVFFSNASPVKPIKGSNSTVISENESPRKMSQSIKRKIEETSDFFIIDVGEEDEVSTNDTSAALEFASESSQGENSDIMISPNDQEDLDSSVKVVKKTNKDSKGESMLIKDANGNNPESEEDLSSQTDKVSNEGLIEHSKKRRSTYVSTKLKRIKGNPNRKSLKRIKGNPNRK